MLDLDIRDQQLRGIFAPDAALERVLTGFKFTEGIVWHPRKGHLTFSDITGNSIWRWTPNTPPESKRDIRPNSHLANGNTYDRDGRLLTCHHATSRVTREEPDGTITVIAAEYQGAQLNSPNDIIVRRDGAIYFTDPLSGREPFVGIPRAPDLPFRGVYRLEPDTLALALLVDDFDKPNGLCFSLDETRLFINDSARLHIRAFDVRADGTLANGRLWAETRGAGRGVPDGMKIDSAGILFCCAQGGVHVFDARGMCLGVLRVPEQAANLCWGDADLRTLYIAASTSIYRVRVVNAGLALFT